MTLDTCREQIAVAGTQGLPCYRSSRDKCLIDDIFLKLGETVRQIVDSLSRSPRPSRAEPTLCRDYIQTTRNAPRDLARRVRAPRLRCPLRYPGCQYLNLAEMDLLGRKTRRVLPPDRSSSLPNQ